MDNRELYVWPTKDADGWGGTVIACSRKCAELAAEGQDVSLAGDWIEESNSVLDYCEGDCE